MCVVVEGEGETEGEIERNIPHVLLPAFQSSLSPQGAVRNGIG